MPETQKQQKKGVYISISLKFILFTLFLFITVIAISFYFFNQTKEHDLGAVVELEKHEVNHLASLLEQQFDSYISNIEIIHRLPEVQMVAQTLATSTTVGTVDGVTSEEWRRRLSAIFVGFAEANPLYTQVRYLDENGMERVRVNSSKDGVEIVEDAALQDKSRRDYFLAAKETPKDQVYVSPIDLNIENNKIAIPYQPIVRYIKTIWSDTGEFRGMVILNIDVREIFNLLKNDFANINAVLEEGETLSLLDHEGYYFVNSKDPQLEFGRQLHARHISEYYVENKEFILSSPLTAKFGFSGDESEYTKGTNNPDTSYVHRVIHYNPYEQDTFLILIKSLSNEKVIEAVTANFKNRIYFLSSIFAIIFSLAYILFVNPMIKRIVRNVHAVKKIGEGDFSANLEVHGNDEIAEVAVGINEMIAQLNKRNQESDKQRRLLEKRAEELETGNVSLKNSEKATLNILEDLDEEKKIVEKRIEERTEELQKEKSKLDIVTHRMVTGAILLDAHGQTIFINEKLKNLLGLDSYDEVNVMDHFFKKFNDAHLKKVVLDSVMHQKSAEIVEIDIEGRVYTILLRSISEVDVENKRFVGTVIFIRDITDEKLLERSKSELVAVASHQLRTPLTAIRGNIEMLIDESFGTLNKEQHTMLDEIQISSIRLISMVNDMLDITKIEKGDLEMNMTEINLKELTDSIVVDLQQYAKEHDFSITTKKPKAAPMIQGDTIRVRQVIQNIIDNAIKYCRHPGELKISFSEVDDQIEIRFVDNGIGVPKAEQPNLFKRFYRATNTAQSTSSGTGLGLYIVKSIVEQLGGSITFTSEENVGTTFFIRFPKHIA